MGRYKCPYSLQIVKKYAGLNPIVSLNSLSEKPYESWLFDIIEKGAEKIICLARQIFTAFPRLVTGLKCYILIVGALIISAI